MPDNPFAEEQKRRQSANPFAAEIERREKVPSAGYAFGDRAARTILNNVMAMPDTSGELMANAINVARAGAPQLAGVLPRAFKRMMGQEVDSPSFGERYASATETEGVKQKLLRGIPRPTTEGIGAAIESIPALLPGGNSPSREYELNRFENAQDAAEMREAHPTASMAGDLAGDIATLLVGRRGTKADRLVQRLESRLVGRAAADSAANLAQDVGKILKGPNMQRLARGSLRSVETGAEAMVLDVLKDPNADPLETAAIAAGSQLAGSGILAGAKGLVSGGVGKAGINITVAAMTTWGFLQVLKSSTPGGQDRILESMESGYDKVALLLGAGLASAAIGATRYGRGNTNFSNQTRTYLDSLGTVHRGTLLSVLSDWTEGTPEEQATIETVLTSMSREPTYRGKNEAERRLVQRIRTGAGLVRYKSGDGF